MTSHQDAFARHLEGDTTTLCHCWLLERQDGRTFGFTDHDMALRIEGQGYEPQSGLTRTEATQSLGMSIDMMDVEGALTSHEVSESDIAAGLYDGAEVTTLLVNWRAPDEHRIIAHAMIGRIARRDGTFVAELESPARHLDRPQGRLFRRRCDAGLGDERCRVSVTGSRFIGEGVVGQRLSAGHYIVSGLDGFAPGWFSQGRLTWISGALEGEAVHVADHRLQTGGTVIVVPEGAAQAGIGDSFTIAAGCDKRFETCRDKFENSANFRGFPHLPGNDAAYAYVSEGRRFDGGVLVE